MRWPTGATRIADSGSMAGARDLSFDLLVTVLDRRQPLDESFAAHPLTARLAARDRAFALNVTATALRRLGQIDALIARFVPRALPSRAEAARALLRLGLAQLLFLGTPAHAAVNETVAIAGQHHLTGLMPLINAVLRRAASEGAAIIAGQDAARLNTPDWLWESWCEAYGVACARAIAEANLRDPTLDLTAKGDPANVVALLGGTLLPTGTVRLAETRAVAEMPGFADGAWWVQDAAAALPVRLFGDVAGKVVLDLCAAPGGKTAQLAAAGAKVIAVDRSAARLQRLKSNLERLRLHAEVIAADVGSWRPQEPVDAILLDAPCSATGTIRRHPDVARLKQPKDVAALASTQARLLTAAAAMLRPGGVLVYCACSLQPEEGPQQIASLLGAGTGIARLPIDPAELAGLAELLTPEGDLRSLPCHLETLGGLDGFYAARLICRI